MKYAPISRPASQTIGFWVAVPIVQPAGASQAAVTLRNTDGEIGGLTISAACSQAEVQALRDKSDLAGDVWAGAGLVKRGS